MTTFIVPICYYWQIDIIYNELLIKGYNVDAGVVEYSYYEEKKRKQEQQSLSKINDSFKKIIIVKDGSTHYNESGILILNLFEMLQK